MKLVEGVKLSAVQGDGEDLLGDLVI